MKLMNLFLSLFKLGGVKIKISQDLKLVQFVVLHLSNNSTRVHTKLGYRGLFIRKCRALNRHLMSTRFMVMME